MPITAEQITTAKRKAVEAVSAFYNYKDPDPPAVDIGNRLHKTHHARQDVARRAVYDAVTIYGVTPWEIATAAGLRQLLVARLIQDRDRRIDALQHARHDAERYRDEVMQAIRDETLAQIEHDMSEVEAAKWAGVERATVRAWRGK